MLYRLWARLYGDPVSEWEAARAGFWDDAVRGSSALRAAIGRALQNELALSEGLSTVAVLWDLEKFYDTVRLTDLISAAERGDFPMVNLVMSVTMYLAPRIVAVNSCCSTAVQPYCSLTAGCRFANSMARVLLYHLLEGLHARYPIEAPRQFVDDLAQFAAGKAATLADGVAACAIELVQGARAKGCKISSKTKIVGSDPEVVDTIRARVRAHTGVDLQPAAWARDLGVSFSGGTRRSSAMQARSAKAKRRTQRVRRLARATRTAAKLYRTGVWAQDTFGAEVCGVPPTQLSRQRSLAASSTGAPRSSCVTSAIAVGHGAHWDPALKMRLKQFSAWMDLWSPAGEQLRSRIRRAWTACRRRLAQTPKADRWRGVIGPVGATIATLLDIGWNPVAPDFWKAPEWDWQLGDERFETPAFVASVARAVSGPLWREAAKHHGGGGLEKGGDVSTLRKHIIWLNKKGRPLEAALLQTIGSGGAWTESRFAEAGLRTSALCLRCGAAAGTPLHAYWQCPDNACIDDPAVRDTEHLTKRATAATAPECFWTRGIVPAHWLETSQPDEFDAEELAWGDQTLFHCEDGDVRWATDGSGGKCSRQPLLRRCGWAAVAVKFSDENPNELVPTGFAARFGHLRSCKQTVPRAEAHAWLRLQQLAGPGARSGVVDCQSVVDGISNLDRAVKSGNGDLWAEIRDDRLSREYTLQPKKVKSHAKGKDFHAGLEARDAVANEVADVFADMAADRAALPSNEALQVEWVCGLAWTVQRRILCITRRCLEFRPPREITQRRVAKRKAPALPLLEEIVRSMHTPRKRARWWQCEACSQRPGKSGPRALREFLRAECRAAPPHTSDIEANGGEDDEESVCQEVTHENAGAIFKWELAESDQEEEDVFGHGLLGLDNDPSEGVAAPPAGEGVGLAGQALAKRSNLDEDEGPCVAKRPRGDFFAIDGPRRYGELPPWWVPALGSAQLHASHSFAWHRGCTWCWRCGAYATQVARSLRRQCRHAPSTPAAAQRLDRLRQGFPPKIGGDWPQPAELLRHHGRDVEAQLSQKQKGSNRFRELRERVLARERACTTACKRHKAV